MIQIEGLGEVGPIVKLRVARALRGLPAYFTTAYWVDGLLIDTGCAHTAGQLVTACRDWRLDTVVNTHSHEDHIGANADLQALFQCPVLAHAEALPILEDPRLQSLQPYRRILWGWPKPSRAQAIGDQVETSRFRFQVIHTPGHSPDHVCLFEPQQGWLFSGDTYIGGQDRALRAGYDIQQIIASLEELAKLPVSIIFAGSGTVRPNGSEALREKIVYLEELGQRVRALRAEGLSPRRIRRRVLGRELPIAYVTLGHFSGAHLIRSFLDEGAPDAKQAERAGEGVESEGS